MLSQTTAENGRNGHENFGIVTHCRLISREVYKHGGLLVTTPTTAENYTNLRYRH
jgi:hypothetical protein